MEHTTLLKLILVVGGCMLIGFGIDVHLATIIFTGIGALVAGSAWAFHDTLP